jgi:KDO2-lipid IV(A) lauroyltransferase
LKKFIVQSLIQILAFLPLAILRKLGAFIGIIALRLSKRSGKRLRENLLKTGIANATNVDKVARNTAISLGQTLIETMCIAWHRSKKYNASLIKGVIGFEEVMKIAQTDTPIVFLTPHIGNFEIALKYTACHIAKEFTILYKPSKSKWQDDMMKEGREEDNIVPVPTNRNGVMTLVKKLRANGLVGILPDSVASSGDGVWVKFFDQPVFATTLAAKMVLFPKSRAFIVGSRRVKGGFNLEFIPFQTISTDVVEVVQEIYQVIERLVLEAPTEYYWSYDRFRVPDRAKLSRRADSNDVLPNNVAH